MRFNSKLVTLLICLLFSQHARPWTEHGKMMDVLLSVVETENPYAKFLNTPVNYESLDDFLASTQSQLPAELNDVELWAQKNVVGYRFLPQELKYIPEQCALGLSLCFKQAIRINTRVPLGDVIQDFRNMHSQNEPAQMADFSLSNLLDKESVKRFLKFTKKRVSSDVLLVREMLATYVDEPDFGLDINLYDDNEEHYPYRFGTQPIGVANVPYVSQFLFHASTYNEAKLVKLLSPRLKENYPIYRAHLYFQLAHFAQREGHLYWAVRFLSWGLHYVQDLTQPYHSKLFPEYSNEQMLFWFMKKQLGFPRDYEDAQQIIANRHLVIEHLLSSLFYKEQGEFPDRMRRSLKKSATFSNVPSCENVGALMQNSILPEIAHNAKSFVTRFDQALPSDIFRNPQFDASNFENYGSLFDDLSEAHKYGLISEYSDRLKYFAVYTKACLFNFAGSL